MFRNKEKDFSFIKHEIEKEGYKLLQDFYENSSTGMKIECPNGHITNTMTYANWRNGKRCSACVETRGERKVRKYLEKNNIKFKAQKSFKGCKFKQPLLFDFYLPDYNLCIEYDGEQHFRPISGFGGEEEFEKVKIRDEIKNQYCTKHNIDLLRIPYWEKDNLEKIIDKHISINFNDYRKCSV